MHEENLYLHEIKQKQIDDPGMWLSLRALVFRAQTLQPNNIDQDIFIPSLYEIF